MFVLPETLEQADPTPCIARAMNKRPKLLLKANAKNKIKYIISSNNLFTKS
jgi:hypothetical protein